MFSPAHTLAFIDGLGGPEIFIILIVVLLLFGGERMPGLAKGLGKAMREFKKASSDVEREIKLAIDEAPDPDAKLPATAPVARVEYTPPPAAPSAPAVLPPPATLPSPVTPPPTNGESAAKPSSPAQPHPRLPDVNP